MLANPSPLFPSPHTQLTSPSQHQAPNTLCRDIPSQHSIVVAMTGGGEADKAAMRFKVLATHIIVALESRDALPTIGIPDSN